MQLVHWLNQLVLSLLDLQLHVPLLLFQSLLKDFHEVYQTEIHSAESSVATVVVLLCVDQKYNLAVHSPSLRLVLGIPCSQVVLACL